MGKRVNVDKKNRIYITNVIDNTELDWENKREVAVHPNAFTGVIYDPDMDVEKIIESLKAHITHFEMLIEEEEE